MDKIVDYFLFSQSPWAYLGHDRFVAIARKAGATIRVRPMDGAKVFPVSGGLPLAQRPAQRRAYRLTELARWRDWLGVPLNIEPKFFFPVANDPAAKLIVAAEEVSTDAAIDVAGRVLAAVWRDESNVADPGTLVQIARAAGLDGDSVLKRSNAPDIAARYDTYSQQAIGRQIFGSPTYVYRDELFWGQDRLDFLERALAR